MFPPINEIKRRRKFLDITQADLAKKSGVSQSLIAKVESGISEPSYLSAKKIFETLDALESKNCTVARDIMKRRVVAVQKSELVYRAIEIMKKFNVSQIPVMSGDLLSGSVSEKSILDKIAGGKQDIASVKIHNIMDDAYPTIGENTPLATVISILQHNPAILVITNENISGIITKADIFKIVKLHRQ
ncbi:MAG: CBS domain-containing protein [Candidatus Aenigmarchaeota archaeon]|nr:CBS domain-containing protein [Candidatus Aenigmarchaeota archaeon]